LRLPRYWLFLSLHNLTFFVEISSLEKMCQPLTKKYAKIQKRVKGLRCKKGSRGEGLILSEFIFNYGTKIQKRGFQGVKGFKRRGVIFVRI